jgi:hypothetical protein
MDEIVIHHNDELGGPLWSVCLRSDFDNWIYSFDEFGQAVDLANERQKELGLNIKIDCSVTNCRIRHSLTSDVPDTTCG